jgi:hypothetical protein
MSEPSSNPSIRARWCELIDLHLLGTISNADAIELEAILALSRDAREDYRQRCNVDAALRQEAAGQSIPTRMTAPKPARWLTWRPLTAAAAGLVIGLFSASLVFGFVAQRVGVVKKVPLAVYDPGLESTEPITARDVPSRVGAWGAKAARVVAEESGVEPQEGLRMLRLEPTPRDKNGETHLSPVYQMLGLRSLPKASRVGDAEVQVTASFCAANREVSSLYSIRIFAINQPPDKARSRFWQKTEEEGVVITQQTFGTAPEDGGWHSFSLKMPLPRNARTLVIILSAGVPKAATAEAGMYYLDDVQVSVITPEPLP